MEINLSKTINLEELIDKKEEEKREERRLYLGASSLYSPCDRKTWLSIHWAINEEKNGRIRRLLETGNREEDVMAQHLRDIRMNLLYTGDDQLTLHLKGNVIQCHPDGYIESGVPTAEKTPHMWENKTMNKANFEKLVKEGVMTAKPEHYAQMQCEMYGSDEIFKKKIDRCLYTVICKDDSRIYAERVDLNETYAKEFIENGYKLFMREDIPARVSNNPTFWICKMCPCYNFCFPLNESSNFDGMKNVNCRTCAYGRPIDDKDCWYCEKYEDCIPKKNQETGCRAHVFLPDLTPFRLNKIKSTSTMACYEIFDTDGNFKKTLYNGEDGVDSRELIDEALKCLF